MAAPLTHSDDVQRFVQRFDAAEIHDLLHSILGSGERLRCPGSRCGKTIAMRYEVARMTFLQTLRVPLLVSMMRTGPEIREAVGTTRMAPTTLNWWLVHSNRTATELQEQRVATVTGRRLGLVARGEPVAQVSAECRDCGDVTLRASAQKRTPRRRRPG